MKGPGRAKGVGLSRCLALGLLVQSLAGCATISALQPVDPDRLASLGRYVCKPSGERIYRVTVFRDLALIGVFDLEQAGSKDGAFSSVLRSETMEELFRWSFEKNLAPSPSMLQSGDHSISAGNDYFAVDGRIFRLGVGEFACLAGGMLPGSWLQSEKIFWDQPLKMFVLRQDARTLRFFAAEDGRFEVRVEWSSNWFSTTSIRVIITGNSPDDTLRGTMTGPYGFSIKWIEV